MRGMKKLALILLCVALALSLSGCDLLEILYFRMLVRDSDDRAGREAVMKYVRANESLLSDCLRSGDYEALDKSGIITDISVRSDHVDFGCGGAGIGSETAYCGFYYVENDDMSVVWCAHPYGETLHPSGSGYIWKESGGDNVYYTEHICGHFYYYEACF